MRVVVRKLPVGESIVELGLRYLLKEKGCNGISLILKYLDIYNLSQVGV